MFRTWSSKCNSYGKDGFTFLEVLICLAVLTVLAVVVFHAYVGIHRVTEEARLVEESSLVASRIASERWLGHSAAETMASIKDDGWNIDFESVETIKGTNRLVWQMWTISPSNRPSGGTVLYLRGGGT